MWRILWGLSILVTLFLASCTGQQGSAQSLLPDIPNTSVVEGQTISQFIGKLTDGAALMAASPQLIPVIQRVEASVVCYQTLGAVALRTYTDKTFPLSAGIIAVVDGRAVKDPVNFAHCVLGLAQGSASAESATTPTIQPCIKNYTLKKSDNEFYIAYIATTKEMCEAFCSKLEGCTGQ